MPYDIITLTIYPDADIYLNGEVIDNNCDFDNPDDNTYDNYLDLLLMYKWSYWQNFDPCLTPVEMNFYWESTEGVCFDLLFDCLSEVIGDRELKSVDVFGTNDTGEYYHYLHMLTNTYCHWLINANDPGSFD